MWNWPVICQNWHQEWHARLRENDSSAPLDVGTPNMIEVSNGVKSSGPWLDPDSQHESTGWKTDSNILQPIDDLHVFPNKGDSLELCEIARGPMYK